jgi:hypothetical protein
MVWYSEDAVSINMSLYHTLIKLGGEDVLSMKKGGKSGDTEMGSSSSSGGGGGDMSEGNIEAESRNSFLKVITPLFLGNHDDDDDEDEEDDDDEDNSSHENALVSSALKWTLSPEVEHLHVMEASRERLLGALVAILSRGIDVVIEYNEARPDMPITGRHLETYVSRFMVHAIIWGFGGSMSWEGRKQLAELVMSHSSLSQYSSLEGLSHHNSNSSGISAVDLRVRIEDGEWEPWAHSVPMREIESKQVSTSECVIPTTDTLRHEEVIRSCLASHKPLILCGPPGRF